MARGAKKSTGSAAKAKDDTKLGEFRKTLKKIKGRESIRTRASGSVSTRRRSQK